MGGCERNREAITLTLALSLRERGLTTPLDSCLRRNDGEDWLGEGDLLVGRALGRCCAEGLQCG